MRRSIKRGQEGATLAPPSLTKQRGPLDDLGMNPWADAHGFGDEPPATPYAPMESADEEEPDDDAAETTAEANVHGADDSLGLYLRQMGAIPLLTRQQELELARRLEKARQRFRRAALWNWQVLGHVVD